jgi:hypothetical protein
MLAAESGAGLKELMARMGHDNVRAAMIYQHAVRGADKAITDVIHRQIVERGDEDEGPAAGSNELIESCRRRWCSWYASSRTLRSVHIRTDRSVSPRFRRFVRTGRARLPGDRGVRVTDTDKASTVRLVKTPSLRPGGP